MSSEWTMAAAAGLFFTIMISLPFVVSFVSRRFAEKRRREEYPSDEIEIRRQRVVAEREWKGQGFCGRCGKELKRVDFTKTNNYDPYTGTEYPPEYLILSCPDRLASYGHTPVDILRYGGVGPYERESGAGHDWWVKKA